MRTLKIKLEGVTTSFRYPHFLVGRQPSFPMPPPATVYGHVASALGAYPDPEGFRFAYTFTHGGSVDDYEHTWMTEVDTHKKGPLHPLPPNIVMNLNPTLRQVFFAPKLTLYLDTPDLEAWRRAFLEPRYPVVLGRSQDLASYRSAEIVELELRKTGYLEHTILPWSFRPRLQIGQGVLMPRLVSPSDRRDVSWSRFVALEHRVFLPREGEVLRPAEVVTVAPSDEAWTVDPTSPVHRERQRALVWHTLRGVESERLDPSVTH
jgi:CRISPR-associated protein Cas5t